MSEATPLFTQWLFHNSNVWSCDHEVQYFKILLARLTAKLFPPQFVVNAEAGLLIELRTVILASPAFSTSQAWKMVVMACVLLVLIFKVFNYVVSGLEIILSLKSDYMVPPPKTVFV